MDFETHEYAEALLLKAARTHGVQVRKDEVQRQLRDERHAGAFAEWAAMYLTADNLLTADELALYSALDVNGRVDELSGLHDFAEVQPVSEEDIKAAVGELKRSTETINKQNETLEQQHDALSRFVKTNEETEARRQDLDVSRERKVQTERMRVASEVEAASQSLGFRISDLEEQGARAHLSLNRILDETFSSDDTLLSSLQKLGYELDRPDPDETTKMDKLRGICARLISLTVDAVRTRLDNIYMDSLGAPERPERAKSATEEEINALEAEIEGFFMEIVSVAQMSTEHQYLEPALNSATARSGVNTFRSSIVLGYINESLEFVLSRLHSLQTRMDIHISHQSAAASLISTAQSEMSIGVPLPQKAFPQVSVTPSPARKNSSPVRFRSNTSGSLSRHRRRSSSISIVEEEPPLETLMQALSLPTSTFENAESKEEKLYTIARVVDGRQRRLNDLERHTQEAFEMSVSATMDDTRRAILLLRDGLLAESPYGLASLIDPEIVGSLTVLGQEVEKAKEQLEMVEGLRGDKRSGRKEDFLQRWAR